jgi:hypothetical protein
MSLFNIENAADDRDAANSLDANFDPRQSQIASPHVARKTHRSGAVTIIPRESPKAVTYGGHNRHAKTE